MGPARRGGRDKALDRSGADGTPRFGSGLMRAAVLLALYRLCSLACPRAFRREHQIDMEAIFSEGTTRDRIFALCDMVAAGLAERLRIVCMDVRVALRGMTKTPLISTIIVLTFAIGIGA